MKRIKTTLKAALMAAMLTSASQSHALDVDDFVDLTSSASVKLQSSMDDVDFTKSSAATLKTQDLVEDTQDQAPAKASYSLSRIASNLFEGSKDTVLGVAKTAANLGKVITGVTKGIASLGDAVFNGNFTGAAVTLREAASDIYIGATQLPSSLRQAKEGIVTFYEGAKEGLSAAYTGATQVPAALRKAKDESVAFLEGAKEGLGAAYDTARRGYSWVKSWF